MTDAIADAEQRAERLLHDRAAGLFVLMHEASEPVTRTGPKACRTAALTLRYVMNRSSTAANCSLPRNVAPIQSVNQ